MGADLSLVGIQGYYDTYHALVMSIDLVLQTLQENGMKLINGQHRAKGSTVFSFEDPSATVSSHLKRRGHATSPIFSVEPSELDRCQTGFQLSLTPHCLREFKDGKSALDVFAKDA